MELHPDARRLADQAVPRDLRTVPLDVLRAGAAVQARARGDGPSVAMIREEMVAGVPVRLYRPAAASGAAVVYFHGGGWVLGGLDSIDRTCRLLADGADLTVVNVDYRLAPEHPFPAAFDDALAVTRWAVDGGGDLGIDGARVAVAGDSAGGNLAAAVALACRSAVAAQLLVYPAVDATMSSASAQSYVEGPGLVADEMRWFYEQYASGVPKDDWRLSPLLAPDLTGAPPALVITAEHDPLRDEGESYALALAEAGVDATSVRYQGVTHGFFGWGAVIAPGATATGQAIDWLSQRLRSGHRGHGPRSRQGVA